jgi:hypothetical protein
MTDAKMHTAKKTYRRIVASRLAVFALLLPRAAEAQRPWLLLGKWELHPRREAVAAKNPVTLGAERPSAPQ